MFKTTLKLQKWQIEKGLLSRAGIRAAGRPCMQICCGNFWQPFKMKSVHDWQRDRAILFLYCPEPKDMKSEHTHQRYIDNETMLFCSQHCVWHNLTISKTTDVCLLWDRAKWTNSEDRFVILYNLQSNGFITPNIWHHNFMTQHWKGSQKSRFHRSLLKLVTWQQHLLFVCSRITWQHKTWESCA